MSIQRVEIIKQLNNNWKNSQKFDALLQRMKLIKYKLREI
jgi:hypothetical protein